MPSAFCSLFWVAEQELDKSNSNEQRQAAEVEVVCQPELNETPDSWQSVAVVQQQCVAITQHISKLTSSSTSCPVYPPWWRPALTRT
eukprot:978122-Amphidinium_carterae.1